MQEFLCIVMHWWKWFSRAGLNANCVLILVVGVEQSIMLPPANTESIVLFVKFHCVLFLLDFLLLVFIEVSFKEDKAS